MYDLWKYCTSEHCRQLLISLNLFSGLPVSKEGQIACLYRLSRHPEQHYQEIRIPKKGGGFRILQAPDSLLKTVQRNILRHFLEEQAVSPWATAYQKGSSPGQNARIHTGAPLIIKLDIKDFFPNITFPMVYQRAFSSRLLPPAAGMLLASLCCLRERLPQGSPASPYISNLVMRPFDDYMGGWCVRQGIRYSRYCDDITFSGDFDSQSVFRKAGGFLDAMGFQLNREKTRIIPAGRRQTVTGAVVNRKAQADRAYRRRLRQEIYFCRKYGIEAHLAACGDTAGPRAYLQSLLGRIQWVLSLTPEDPEFIGYRDQVKEWLSALRFFPPDA